MSGCVGCSKFKAKDQTNKLCGYCLRKKARTATVSRSNPLPKRKALTGESYYHKASKAILAGWFLNLGYEVALEFPLCSVKKFNAAAYAWHCNESPYRGLYPEGSLGTLLNPAGLKPQPSREWLIEQGLAPTVIFDLAVFKDGVLVRGYEIRHKHKCTSQKIAIIKAMRRQSRVDYRVFEISSRWILSQVRDPPNIKAIKVIREF
jgi:hypothetical protein